MWRTLRTWVRTLPGLQATLGLLFGGCVLSPPPNQPPLAPQPPAAAVRAAEAEPASVEEAPSPRLEATLSLDRLVALSAASNPALAIAQARAQAARGQLIQAGLYPNPIVSWQSDQIGHPRNAAGEDGPIFAQTIVTAGKLRLAQAAAAYGVSAADWQAVTRWFDVLTRVRAAYFEVLTAQRAVETHEGIVRLAQEGLDAATKLQKAGAGTQPDVLRARVELEQTRVQLGVARQRLEAAWKLLAVAVGVPALPAAELSGDLETIAPAFDWQPALATMLARSSEVQEAQALVLQAEQLVRRARAEVVPNVNVMLQPYYVFQDQDPRGLVLIGAAVPLFNRNQGNIAAAEADLARTQQEVRQVELRLTDRLAIAYQRYQSAREQIEAYQKRILPDARESLRLVQIGYEKGDPKYDYTTVLQAQQILFRARLIYVQALGELWRAVSDIAGLLQDDRPLAGEPP
jgi:cobalt-zinc-cadmium efflux system outer membrane protein